MAAKFILSADTDRVMEREEDTMSEETLGTGVVTSSSRRPEDGRHSVLLWGLLCVLGSIGVWHLRHDTTTTITIAVVMMFAGLASLMYARYAWSGVAVPSIVFVGLAAVRVLNLGIEPSFLKHMYPYGWITVLALSSVVLVISIRRRSE